MKLEIIGEILEIEIIAKGNSIKEIIRLKKCYGTGKWRKLKGKALIKITNGIILKTEIHWYECHGIGKKEIKIKKVLK